MLPGRLRQFSQAHADRGLTQNYCGATEHVWVEYGDTVWTYPTDGTPPREEPRVLLIVCSRCRQTPEEASRP